MERYKMDGKKVLIVDDEQDILYLLKYNLEKEGYLIETANSGRLAIEKAKEFIPDIILLDVMLPDIDGMDVCQQLREIPDFRRTVILFLSARGEDYSQIAGYQAGADDYLVKPVRMKVLIQKLKVLVDRIQETPLQKPIVQEGITADLERFSVTINNDEIVIPKKEFELLTLLMSVPEKVFRRDEILSRVWGDAYIGDRTIDVHVRKLRERFGNDIIQTVKGVGYKFIGVQ